MSTWANAYVVDVEPLQWHKHIPVQVRKIEVMDIIGVVGGSTPILTSAHDPNVTEVGVIVVTEVKQKRAANKWLFYGRQYPIFTNGDTYRRLSLNPNGDLASGGYPSNLCNVLFEDATAFWLGVEDGEVIKAAIVAKFGEL